MRSKVLFTFAILIAIVLALVSAIHADVSHDPHNPIPIPCDQSIDFTLTGNRAGAFAYYSIDYPGDGRIITIELDMAPGDPVVMQAAGFNVYGPNAYYIGNGYPAFGKPDRKMLRWADHNPAPWLIQVYNYLHDVPVNFHLRLEGLPDPEPTPTRAPVMQPSEAKTFSLVSASLLGDQGGNYHYYKFESPGNNSTVTLHLYYTPDNHLVAQGFGLNVYGPNGEHCAQGRHDVSFTCPTAGTYLVQVYNYLHAINISYILTRD